MKKSSLSLLAALFASAIAILPVRAGVTVQSSGNVIGTGDQAWSYLVVEGENYDSKQSESLEIGFIRVDNSGARTNSQGNPVLGPHTTASKKGALFTQGPLFGEHADKVTYKVQFAKAGTYYLYMRFTMFENGSNLANYLSEDSFFVPPDFGKDPQTDWPLPRGGYTEGCCDGGFLTIKEDGVPVSHSGGDEAGRAYWEGNFHWNELLSSQFNNPETQGEPRLRFKYEVTAEQVGKPLDFTISYREAGVTIDLFLFSTSPSLMDTYSQADLDLMLVDNGKVVAKQDPSDVVGTGDSAWSYLILEGEDYVAKQSESLETGFVRVDGSGSIASSQGSLVLGPDTTASKKAALSTQGPLFGEHADKVTYRVQFAKAGTYYLYMRFTMFENGSNLANYLSEDSFFVPPDFGKDPQTDWPLPRGGYTEGCCDGGFLTIKEDGIPVSHSGGDEAGRAYWEGKFHWNELLSSQFNNPETQGEPRLRFKYEVTAEQVGKPLDFKISYREAGVTIDLFLFSTNPGLMDSYSQAELDQILVPDAGPKLAIQNANNVVGTGEDAWSFLILEGEDYNIKRNDSLTTGFGRVGNELALTTSQGNPVLGPDTTASRKAALFTQGPLFGEHADKVTYHVQFSKAGTYYLYMRFTMFENGSNLANYLSEDSFFVPPDFGKDPQTDWPLPRGGYTEGCCDGGFLTIKEDGIPVSHSGGDEAGRAYWEGNFHWNELLSSQFNNPETQGEPRLRFKYEVTAEQVGKPLEFTISYREAGVTVDLFLFSTSPALMDKYSQADLDRILLNIGSVPSTPSLSITLSGKNAVLSWPVASEGYALESSTAVAGAAWNAVTDPPVVNGAQNTVTVDASTGTKYYRLKKP